MISTDSEVWEVSWLYQEGVAEGEAKGEAKGKAEGVLDGKRVALRLALNQMFPTLGAVPEIDRVDRSEALDELLLAVLKAHTADDARMAIRAALHLN